MRITFVHSADKTYSDTQMFGLHFPPVWAYTLAAYVHDLPGVAFSIVDDRVQNLGEATESDLFLYSGMNQDREAVLGNRERLASRFPRALHCIGGPICWSFQQAGRLTELSSVFDHCFVGDGEVALRDFLTGLAEKRPFPRVIQAPARFALRAARAMHLPLLTATRGRYYGAVIEVARGCPFLCEFCDIRVQPDNNRSHGKPVNVILEEIDFFSRAGVSQMILACDNFIGDSAWAESVCDEIIAWKTRTGLDPRFYTWLTIDIARHERLMNKLKLAGIDMLFIGVESFHRNSLLETSKLQNTSIDMVDVIRQIQSHGLIVVAGLIFGFDTDPDDIVQVTLDGIRRAGLISGDPSLLTALPGTPLYLRMKLSGRLRDGKLGLGGFKYKTNISYLKPTEAIVADFTAFVARFNSGDFQYERLASLYDCLPERLEGPGGSGGFTQLGAVLRVITRNHGAVVLLGKRVLRLLASAERLRTILRAFRLTARLSGPNRPLWRYFKFWLFNWSNSLIKYERLNASDFDIGSVGECFDWDRLVPEGYEDTHFEPIPAHKVRMQRKTTAQSLRRLRSERLALAAKEK